MAEAEKLFEWCDGVLVQAMHTGCCLLIDEISLAEDAVLERLNSVLEPERKLLISERGSDENASAYEVVAHKDFVLIATMNPGGDYGKKEVQYTVKFYWKAWRINGRWDSNIDIIAYAWYVCVCS